MLAVVKTPHIEIRGKNIPAAFLDLVRDFFKKPVEIVEDPEESVDAFQTEWYQKTKESAAPGEWVAVYRHKRGHTQKELGELLGVSAQNVSEIERGKRAVSVRMANKLAAIYQVDAARFVNLNA